VLTVWAWTPEVLEEWFTEFRPLFGSDGNPAAWPSERGLRVGCQRLNSRFVAYREALGFDAGLDFHSLRRSYVTHLIEDGYDPRFVQEQVGHEHASTTSLYTCVSSDFRTRTLRRHLAATVAEALERTEDRLLLATAGSDGQPWDVHRHRARPPAARARH
jgi:integrase/recombinase XerC